jgi:hypothetical protein
VDLWVIAVAIDWLELDLKFRDSNHTLSRDMY